MILAFKTGSKEEKVKERPEKVKKELTNLRKPVKEVKKLQINVFGNFEVYYDGNPLKFKYTKSIIIYSILLTKFITTYISCQKQDIKTNSLEFKS